MLRAKLSALGVGLDQSTWAEGGSVTKLPALEAWLCCFVAACSRGVTHALCASTPSPVKWGHVQDWCQRGAAKMM